jgi:uncharacterized lipoprotein YajG
MNRVPSAFRVTKIDPPSPSYGAASIADSLGVTAILLVILMTVTFFAGCATKSDTDSNSMIQKQESDHQIHGEAGVMYGRGS